jgi:hypothetical protein
VHRCRYELLSTLMNIRADSVYHVYLDSDRDEVGGMSRDPQVRTRDGLD